MVSVLPSSVVDHGYESQQGDTKDHGYESQQGDTKDHGYESRDTKDYKIGICCFSTIIQ